MTNPVFFHKGSAKISATSTTDRATLATVGSNVIVYNAGPNLAYIELGGSTVTATVPTNAGTGSQPVPPGFYAFTISRSADTQTNVAAICDAGNTATVYFSVGNGT